MEQNSPLAQGAGTNVVVNVYPDRVELVSGWQGQNIIAMGLRQVVDATVRGVINATLTIETNDGRQISIERMAPPDARRIKTAIEQQKKTAGLYE
ncbi:MAG: hypothetical protein M3P37_01690 [Actinomycetota bacterium]|nr:hypothetical protein [Actinomycetota bacterium]